MKHILIEINSGGDQSPKSKVQSPKSLLPVRRTRDYSPRRSRPSFIEFYDLARIIEENNWIDLEFEVEASYTTSGAALFMNPLTLSHFGQMQELILTNGVENLKNNFSRISLEESRIYDFFVYINGLPAHQSSDLEDEAWTEAGFKLTEEELSSVIQIGNVSTLFYTLIFNGSDRNKITTEPDYNAPAAAFELKAKAKIFLFPILFRLSMLATLDNSNAHYLIANYQPFPRIQLFDNQTEHYHKIQKYATWNEDDADFSQYYEAQRLYRLIRSYCNNLQSVRREGFAPTIWTPENPLTFPNNPAFGETPSNDAFSFQGGFITNVIGNNEVLAAVIEQDGSFYYVWETQHY